MTGNKRKSPTQAGVFFFVWRPHGDSDDLLGRFPYPPAHGYKLRNFTTADVFSPGEWVTFGTISVPAEAWLKPV
jgi:hypothetical protein